MKRRTLIVRITKSGLQRVPRPPTGSKTSKMPKTTKMPKTSKKALQKVKNALQNVKNAQNFKKAQNIKNAQNFKKTLTGPTETDKPARLLGEIGESY